MQVTHSLKGAWFQQNHWTYKKNENLVSKFAFKQIQVVPLHPGWSGGALHVE
jgi:hypothetical protein